MESGVWLESFSAQSKLSSLPAPLANASESREEEEPHHWASLLLLLIPTLTILGNGLVVLAILREKSLKTVLAYHSLYPSLEDWRLDSKIAKAQSNQ